MAISTDYSLKSVIIDALKERELKQVQFCSLIGAPTSFFSRVLSGGKSIPMPMLDKAISVLSLNEEECYMLYLEDWKAKKKSSRLIENYIVHCEENGKEKYAEQALSIALELRGYLPAVYGAAEELYQKGRKKQALRYFDAVIANESDKKSSLLAMSYYRRLLTFYETDTDKSEEAALQLCEHLDYVKEEEILEAHYKVIATYRLKNKWDYVLRYGEKLVCLARSMNNMEYVGDALIRMAIAAREKGDFNMSLQYIDEYGSLPVEKYRFFAEGNRLITQITAGDTDKIYDLLDFAKRNKERCFELMEFLLDSLVKHEKLDLIEEFFQEFPDQIHQLESMKGQHSIYDRHLINFLYAKSLYLLRRGEKSGVDTALYAGDIAVALRLDKQAIQSALLVLENVSHTTPEQYKRCLDLLNRVAC